MKFPSIRAKARPWVTIALLAALSSCRDGGEGCEAAACTNGNLSPPEAQAQAFPTQGERGPGNPGRLAADVERIGNGMREYVENQAHSPSPLIPAPLLAPQLVVLPPIPSTIGISGPDTPKDQAPPALFFGHRSSGAAGNVSYLRVEDGSPRW